MITKTSKTFDKVLAFQKVTREWRPHLSIAERDFCIWFIDSTVSYGRTKLTATVPQMISGMHSSRTGELWLKPIEMGARTVERVLKGLCDKGVLSRRKVTSRITEYTICLNWKPLMSLPISKKRAVTLADKLHPGAELTGIQVPENEMCPANLAVQMDNLPRQIGGPKLYSKKDKPHSSRRQGSDGRSGVEVVRDIMTKPPKPKKADEITRVEQLWKNGWKEGGYTSVSPLLGKAHRGMLFTAHSRLPDAGDDFITWAVANWRQIVSEKFSWMTKPGAPPLPDPKFLLGHVGPFMDAFTVFRQIGDFRLMDDEKREYEMLRTSLSHDDTMLKIGELRATAKMARKMAKNLDEVNALHRALQLDRKAPNRSTSVPRRPAPPPVAIDHGSNPYDNPNSDLSGFEPFEEYE